LVAAMNELSQVGAALVTGESQSKRRVGGDGHHVFDPEGLLNPHRDCNSHAAILRGQRVVRRTPLCIGGARHDVADVEGIHPRFDVKETNGYGVAMAIKKPHQARTVWRPAI